MRDFATSDSPEVQAQLDRLAKLSLPQGRFGLETIRELLARLGNPQSAIPPAFHVAGTNGKGSTCAYLTSILEAQGFRVHSATKPHLVRYNERIRLAGTLISDELLAQLLAQVLDASVDLNPSFFEVTTAAMFLAFLTVPADVCVIEVGLGGRFDATNVLETAISCGIASLGIDHEAFLLAPEVGVPQEPLPRIAFEKASIAQPGVPLVTQNYGIEVAKVVVAMARERGARLAMRGVHWSSAIGGTIAYRDAYGALELPLPTLAGAHQADNAALAVAMLRHQQRFAISDEAMVKGITAARWPARLQLLGPGPLTALVQRAENRHPLLNPPSSGEVAARSADGGVSRYREGDTPPPLRGTSPTGGGFSQIPHRKVWLDGGHNPDAGLAIARYFAEAEPFHLIIGMLTSKDPSAIVAPLAGKLLSLSVVPAPGHEAHRPEDFAPHSALPVRRFKDVSSALAALPKGGDVLIAGSLYLAGEVLRLNREFPG